MTEETANTRISHEDVEDILVAGDCLRLELHNGVIVSLPSKTFRGNTTAQTVSYAPTF